MFLVVAPFLLILDLYHPVDNDYLQQLIHGQVRFIEVLLEHLFSLAIIARPEEVLGRIAAMLEMGGQVKRPGDIFVGANVQLVFRWDLEGDTPSPVGLLEFYNVESPAVRREPRFDNILMILGKYNMYRLDLERFVGKLDHDGRSGDDPETCQHLFPRVGFHAHTLD